jgi:hypothetical protein
MGENQERLQVGLCVGGDAHTKCMGVPIKTSPVHGPVAKDF